MDIFLNSVTQISYKNIQFELQFQTQVKMDRCQRIFCKIDDTQPSDTDTLWSTYKAFRIDIHRVLLRDMHISLQKVCL